MENTKSVSSSKKSNTWLYLLGGAGVLAILLLSSFTSASSTTLPACSSNPNCLKGYWKWQIMKTPDWLTTISKGRSDAETKAAVAQTADWVIGEKWALKPDFSDWDALVQSETAAVVKMTGNTPENALSIAMSNIIARV